MTRWILAGIWVVAAGATFAGFALGGVNDPQALPFVAALSSVVATLLIASIVCLMKARTWVGIVGLLSLAALPIAHFGSAAFSIQGWAPTFFADVLAIGVVVMATIAVGAASLLKARNQSHWARGAGAAAVHDSPVNTN